MDAASPPELKPKRALAVFFCVGALLFFYLAFRNAAIHLVLRGVGFGLVGIWLFLYPLRWMSFSIDRYKLRWTSALAEDVLRVGAIIFLIASILVSL